MSFGAELWILVAFVVFCGILWGLGVHRRIVGILDTRQSRVRDRLSEARRLRDEAEAVLGEIQRRKSEVEREAGAIIAAANAEADRLVADAQAKMENYAARRIKLMETKIGRAETEAVSEVRGAAVDAAVAVAEKILVNTLKRDGHERVMNRSMDDMRANIR
jgi:F-type H+-transporting ATPase subunit b